LGLITVLILIGAFAGMSILGFVCLWIALRPLVALLILAWRYWRGTLGE